MVVSSLSIIEKVLQGTDSENKLAWKTLEVMYFTRLADEKMSKLVRQNKGGTFHLEETGLFPIIEIGQWRLVLGVLWMY